MISILFYFLNLFNFFFLLEKICIVFGSRYVCFFLKLDEFVFIELDFEKGICFCFEVNCYLIIIVDVKV